MRATIERSSLAAFFGFRLHRGPSRDHHWIVTTRIAIVVLALAACSKDGGGGTGSGSAAGGSAAASTGSSAAKKGGGFSAALSADLAAEGSGSAAPPAGTATPAASSNVAATAPAAGSAAPAAGSAAPAAGSAAPAAGSNAVAMAKAADTKAADAKAADMKVAAKPAGDVARPSDHRGPVKVSAELAAIKMDLEPNWDRDFDEAGTISFVLKVPNTGDTRLFSFHYGYDPAAAPADRDAYMKWLGDQKLLNVTLNRQRGAAWYLEGTDGNGAPAFRYLVNYGGKHLICYGTLYKDAASTSLGDLRDKVVMAAKKICETMTL